MKNVLPFVTNNIKHSNRIFVNEKKSTFSNLLNLLECSVIANCRIRILKTNFKQEDIFIKKYDSKEIFY
jgi:hypothetical protein